MSQPRHHHLGAPSTDTIIEIAVTNASSGSVDGRPVSLGQFPSIHQACVIALKARAAEAGEPLLAHAIDTISGRTEYWIRAYPDGTTANAEAPVGYGVVTPEPPRPVPAAAGPSNLHHDPRRDPSGATNGGHATAGPAGSTPAYAQAPTWQQPLLPGGVQQLDNGGSVWDNRAAGVMDSPSGLGLPPSPAVPEAVRRPPTRADLRAAAPAPPEGPATIGWQASLNHLTGGLMKLGPGPKEKEHRNAIRIVQRSWAGPRTVVVINSKGGGIKTTTSYRLGSIFGALRGGYVLAWDNNESNGNLGSRSAPAHHENTVLELFRDLEQFAHSPSSQVGDLDNYVRSQPSRFDVLASKEAGDKVDAHLAEPNPMLGFGAEEFVAVHSAMSRYYRLVIVDTGNQVGRPNWLAAVKAADQLVVAVTAGDDIAQGGAGALDHLVNLGHGEAVSKAITVLTHRDENPDKGDLARIRDHFHARTRGMVEIPYSKPLTRGVRYTAPEEHTATYEAWLHAAALIATGL